MIAKGCALQALSLLTAYTAETPAASIALIGATLSSSAVIEPKSLVNPIGLNIDGEFITLVLEKTPLPLRRIIDIAVPAGSSTSSVLLSLTEGTHSIKVEDPAKKAKAGFFSRAKNDDEDEDDEPEEIRTAIITPASVGLVDVEVPVTLSKQSAPVRVTLVVDAEGRGTVVAQQGEGESVKGSFSA